MGNKSSPRDVELEHMSKEAYLDDCHFAIVRTAADMLEPEIQNAERWARDVGSPACAALIHRFKDKIQYGCHPSAAASDADQSAA